eukprot:gnl/TRDRNA2_/TRDRNA2_83537_c0_seq1.p1 gnl/TRDRNA2_/TRDRNA2_83537_c0~~gnl/TRDRNA2_/TRDRNA2_83537_c0_seq1.p1  ORF type:complete len:289 (+),score=30.63 gnl/TRDRNA2_/TRDRNA2_83537_c0_seq1:66-932(+)
MLDDGDGYRQISFNDDNSEPSSTQRRFKVRIALLSASFVILLSAVVWVSRVANTSAEGHLQEVTNFASRFNVNLGSAASSVSGGAFQSGALQSWTGRSMHQMSAASHNLNDIPSPHRAMLRNRRAESAEKQQVAQGAFLSRSLCGGIQLSNLHIAAADQSHAADAKGVILGPKRQDDEVWLAWMIARYLDTEWCALPVHEKIGDKVAKLYAEARDEGEDEMSAISMRMSTGLQEVWKSEGFTEAFEGPCDVGNRAAEFLMVRLGREVNHYNITSEMMSAWMRQYKATH